MLERVNSGLKNTDQEQDAQIPVSRKGATCPAPGQNCCYDPKDLSMVEPWGEPQVINKKWPWHTMAVGHVWNLLERIRDYMKIFLNPCCFLKDPVILYLAVVALQTCILLYFYS